MAPRLNKRQQREQEELAALKTTGEADSDENDAQSSLPAQKQGGFAALLGDDNIIEHAVESDQENAEAIGTSKRKVKRKKKKPAVRVEASPTPNSKPPLDSGDSKEHRRAAKKARQKEQKEAAKGKDDLEETLKQLSVKYPSIKQGAGSRSGGGRPLSSLLSISHQNLDPEAELRRFFGSKVVGSAPSTSSKHKPTSHRGVLLSAVSPSKIKGRNSLTTVKENWPHPRYREGLHAIELGDDDTPFYASEHAYGATEEKWYTMVADRKYKGWTKAFVDTVHRGDPNPFYHILQNFPYHADTLMQMGEIAAHREEHSTVSSLLERALYTYERALQVGGVNILGGNARLDYDAVENRGLWLCLGRYIFDILRRGCPVTAHNFAILQLSLDPYIDPYGALFLLDYTSAKTGKTGCEWFEEMYMRGSVAGPITAVEGKLEGIDISTWRWDCLPGWIYTRALARRVVEGEDENADHSGSNSLLLEAFSTYPELIPLLADKTETKVPLDISQNKSTRIVTEYSDASSHGVAMLHLLAHLYAARSTPLWKLPNNTSFFSSNLPKFDPSSKPTEQSRSKRSTFLTLVSSAHSPLSYSIYRHVHLSSQSTPSGQAQNYKRLFKYFPKDIQVVLGRSLSFDPLPPATASSRYESGYWDGVESPLLGTAAGPGGEHANARVVVEQIQGFLDANPELRDRFPGGAQQMAEMMVNDPQALYEGMLAEEANLGNVNEVPGGFENDDGDVNDTHVEAGRQNLNDDDQSSEEEDNDEDDEMEQAAAPSFIQSMFGRFFSFGRRQQEEEHSRSSTEAEPAPDP